MLKRRWRAAVLFCVGTLFLSIEGGGSQARAAEAATSSDLRCVIADSVMANSAPTPQAQAILVQAGLCYPGRIDARDPSLEIGPALAAQLKSMTT